MLRPFTRVLAWAMRSPGRALLIYWPIAFIGTHIPSPWEPSEPSSRRAPYDKFGHFAGYALLAWLLMSLLSRRFHPLAAAALTLLAIAAYGAIDELTQPYFNRSADLPDYYADLIGGAVGVAIAWRRARENYPMKPRPVR